MKLLVFNETKEVADKMKYKKVVPENQSGITPSMTEKQYVSKVMLLDYPKEVCKDGKKLCVGNQHPHDLNKFEYICCTKEEHCSMVNGSPVCDIPSP